MAHTNRISITFDPAGLSQALLAVATVEEGMPPLVNLDAEERRSLPKMGDLTRSFVMKALEIATNNSQFVPPFVNMVELDKDFESSNNLLTVEMQLAALHEKVRDSRILAGSEAYTAALMIYYSLAGAERSGIPGAGALHSELASRFPGNSGEDPAPEPPEM